MALPFEKIEHAVYPRTFLAKVMIGVTFKVDEATLDSDTMQERLRVFLENNFQLELGPVNFKERMLNIKNDEKGIGFIFSHNAVVAFVNGSSYKSFKDSLYPCVSYLTSFLNDVFDVKSVTARTIRKMNVFSLEDEPGANNDLTGTKNLILSNEFLQSESEPVDPVLDMDGVEKKLTWKEQEITINARYQHKLPGEHKIQHWLDLEVISTPAIQIPIDAVNEYEYWEQMNQLLFNALHWSITKNIVQLMTNPA